MKIQLSFSYNDSSHDGTDGSLHSSSCSSIPVYTLENN
jgi:hypothetical protein